MAISKTTKTAKTADVTPTPFQMGFVDEGGPGPYAPYQYIVDATGNIISPMPSVGGQVTALCNGASLEIAPAVTAGAYSSGDVIGGIIQFQNVLAPTSYFGLLKSIDLKFRASVQTVEFDVALFIGPPAGSFVDNGVPAIAANDSALLAGIFAMTANLSPLGTHTIYRMSDIDQFIVGVNRDLYAVVIAKNAPTNPASTSDMRLRLGIKW